MGWRKAPPILTIISRSKLSGETDGRAAPELMKGQLHERIWLRTDSRPFGRSYSTVCNRLLTVDVVFELINRELLITDYAFDKIAD